jgi:hypothetical protein
MKMSIRLTYSNSSDYEQTKSWGFSPTCAKDVRSIHKINLSNKSTDPIINNLSNHWTPSSTYHITLYSNQLIHPNIDPNHWSIKSFVSDDYNIDLITIDSRYLTIYIFHVL